MPTALRQKHGKSKYFTKICKFCLLFKVTPTPQVRLSHSGDELISINDYEDYLTKSARNGISCNGILNLAMAENPFDEE